VLACVESEVTGCRCLDACATRNNLFLCLFSDAVLTACVKQHKEQKSSKWCRVVEDEAFCSKV
jgi:hypothetical protein